MDKTGKQIEKLRSKDPDSRDFRVDSKKKKKSSIKKSSVVGLWILLILCFASLLAVLGYGWNIINERIPKGTVVDGVELGGMLPEDAAAMLERLTEAQTVSVSDENGLTLFTLPLTTLVGQQDYAANLNSAIRGGPLFQVSPDSVSFAVNAALFPEGQPVDEPMDSVLIADGNGLYLTEATHGSLYDASACTEAVCSFLSGDHPFGGIWQISVEHAYAQTGKEADESVLRQKESVEAYTSSVVSINFVGGIEYTLSFSDILAMLNEDCLTPGTDVSVVPERVSSRMNSICDTLGVDGTMAKYGRCAQSREFLYLKPSDTGFILDRTTLDRQVCEALRQHGGQLNTSYDYTWWLKKTYGWHGDVNDCLEVSLDNQYIWFYHGGQLLTEAPIVSGDLATYNITRLGIFQVYGMVEDTVLNGPTWSDHVDYWMPFDGQIGIHDSSWRDEYGGDIYLENGSHGCVNTPIDAMRIVYENSFLGMLVIVR